MPTFSEVSADYIEFVTTAKQPELSRLRPLTPGQHPHVPGHPHMPGHPHVPPHPTAPAQPATIAAPTVVALPPASAVPETEPSLAEQGPPPPSTPKPDADPGAENTSPWPASKTISEVLDLCAQARDILSQITTRLGDLGVLPDDTSA